MRPGVLELDPTSVGSLLQWPIRGMRMAAILKRALIQGTSALVALAVSAGCTTERGLAEAQPGVLKPVTISIVGTNDLHGGLLPQDERGGLALLAGYVNNLRDARSRDGGAVVLVDAGDMWQGTLESNLTEGASVVAAATTRFATRRLRLATTSSTLARRVAPRPRRQRRTIYAAHSRRAPLRRSFRCSRQISSIPPRIDRSNGQTSGPP